MSDIVERLRNGRTIGSNSTWLVTPTHLEAADEIERLRKRLAVEAWQPPCDPAAVVRDLRALAEQIDSAIRARGKANSN